MSEQEIENLKKQIEIWQKRYLAVKNNLVEFERKTLKYKISRRTNKFWSVISVFLDSAETGTSPRQKIKMFFKTMAAWAKRGFKLEPDEVAQARFAICKACPHLLDGKQCSLCGCFMKAKTKVSGASCPAKKW